eukprot:COSAG06_NODE_153_length_21876_cov_5.100628_1_plen_36_part_10
MVLVRVRLVLGPLGPVPARGHSLALALVPELGTPSW